VRALVTGGAGYVGGLVVDELLGAGAEVVVLDALLHDQENVARSLEARGVRVLRGDLREGELRRRALEGADAVVHLAAIVGDPACARAPELSHQVNVEATRALVDDAGARRFVFASTCSNYGRMADPLMPVGEDAPLRPLSLYAEQKVEMECALLAGAHTTCLRFATVYGVASRMRFDLTVNEFTRDLWAGRQLEVFGEQFWRPYVHVRDAARAVALVLSLPAESVAGRVWNVGHSEENYRKLDLIRLIRRRVDRGEVRFVARDEDPRDYRVSFERIRAELGFEPAIRVPDGIDELVRALDARAFNDPFDPRFSNLASL
jgi:nucleoside-diphosphate-sugar epimerase